jgi:hypothetical protein
MLRAKPKRFIRGVFGLLFCSAFSTGAALPPSPAAAVGVRPLFDLSHPAGSPFPSDRFTVRDSGQNTGLRVNLPKPDCTVRTTDCEHIALLNELDGFNVQPRLSVPFSGPIDVKTVNSETVFLASLGNTLGEGGSRPKRVGINQVIWDVSTNTLHLEAEALLDQHTRYALVVTRGVLDAAGDPIEQADLFREPGVNPGLAFNHDAALIEYWLGLIQGTARLVSDGIVRPRSIAAVSIFTTQSVTATLEKVRDQIKTAPLGAAEFGLGQGGARTVFPLNDVTSITFSAQTGAGSTPTFTTVSVPLATLGVVPGVVETIAFGKYTSPDYQVHPGEYIPQVPTRSGIPVVRGTNDIFFNLVLPSSVRPAGGWPVAIFGHGSTNDKNRVLFNVAAKLAEHGIATLGINMPGHGFGPLGTLTVSLVSGNSVTLPAGGRGTNQDGNGAIGADEGSLAAPPRDIIEARDSFIQTAVDLMQLVGVIERGVDVDDDSVPDLDASRIYYVGQSAGGNIGALLLAIDPSVRVGTLTVPGSPRIDNERLSPLRRARVGAELESSNPSLLNVPGIAAFCMSAGQACVDPTSGRVTFQPPHFDDNLSLRNGIPLTVRLTDGTMRDIASPVVNTVPGAMDIQAYVEKAEWVFQSGSSVAYAPFLRRTPLPGVPAKSVIVQFARGDQQNPNPVTTAILRAGDLADRATLYRHDLLFAEKQSANQAVRKNPHVFMPSRDAVDVGLIALGAQEQIAVFLASDGVTMIHPEPMRFFEVPVVFLPEDLNFIP